jgi:hypothetical protein
VRARQTYNSTSQQVIEWSHPDPVGVTESGFGLAAYDPLGNYAGLPEPPPTGQPPPPPSGYYGPIWGGAGSLSTNYNNFATGCLLDGRPADCNRVRHALEDGLGEVQGPRTVRDGRRDVHIEFDPMPMGSPHGGGGLAPYYVPGGQRVASRSGDGGSGGTTEDGEPIEVINHTVTAGGFWTLVPISWAYDNPQSPNAATNSNVNNLPSGPSSNSASNPSHRQPRDPCQGVRARDLNYSRRRHYRADPPGVDRTAEEHIKDRHINLTSNGSQYDTDPRVGGEEMWKHVMMLNALTFAYPDQRDVIRNRRGQITRIRFIKTFPAIPHPIYPGKTAAWIGRLRMPMGTPTLTNTLYLEADCKTVDTSHPGHP